MASTCLASPRIASHRITPGLSVSPLPPRQTRGRTDLHHQYTTTYTQCHIPKRPWIRYHDFSGCVNLVVAGRCIEWARKDRFKQASSLSSSLRTAHVPTAVYVYLPSQFPSANRTGIVRGHSIAICWTKRAISELFFAPPRSDGCVACQLQGSFTGGDGTRAPNSHRSPPLLSSAPPPQYLATLGSRDYHPLIDTGFIAVIKQTRLGFQVFFYYSLLLSASGSGLALHSRSAAKQTCFLTTYKQTSLSP